MPTENIYKTTAWLYDVDTRPNLHEDIPFYLDFAKAQKDEVLELGCGTGRVSLVLAKHGIKTTALDLSDEMLGIFKQKLSNQKDWQEKISIVKGNMASFDLGKKFSLVIAPFRAFQSLTDDNDIANSLQCINNHLSDDGIFIINMFNPYPTMDESWCSGETIQWQRLDESTGNYIVKKNINDKIDTQNRIIYVKQIYQVTSKDGKTENYLDNLKLKYYYQPQIEEALTKANLKIVDKYSWYDKTPLESQRREIILVCTKNRFN